MEKNANQVLKELKEFKAPRYHELPQIPLYMDQVVYYVNSTLDSLLVNQKGPSITASMVNNYVKSSIVKPPVKKKYKDYHLAFLIVVCLLKRCYSLSEIEQMIQIHSNIFDPERYHMSFDSFIGTFERSLHEIMETGQVVTSSFEHPTPEQNLMETAIHAVVCKICTEYKLLEFEEINVHSNSEAKDQRN